ncbi:MAG: bifunctional methionine sulfoxide reductase B/A protein, partial [Dehalococcoidia bacterium]|nr:bifunctional methionine sulfoxide reductase B/A protein [Dehalococcoidia bacterium]
MQRRGTARRNRVKEDTYNELTAEEKKVIVHKGTEPPFTGKYNNFKDTGVYQCRRCNAPLYTSQDKFSSSCGWPSFDDEIAGTVRRVVDADGRRTEILCANCGAHLGHVFRGERLTKKDSRHCVNSLSLQFVPARKDVATAKAYFAGGCFWGVEYLFEHKEGVIEAVSGYMGGSTKNPTYKEVCSGKTGHLEAVAVTYDPAKVSFKELAQFFFEIHDPTQLGGQGPDHGSQYQSAVLYNDDAEKKTAEELIEFLKVKGDKVVTRLIPVSGFWPAEAYHQNYYDTNRHQPYCHRYRK